MCVVVGVILVVGVLMGSLVGAVGARGLLVVVVMVLVFLVGVKSVVMVMFVGQWSEGSGCCGGGGLWLWGSFDNKLLNLCTL